MQQKESLKTESLISQTPVHNSSSNFPYTFLTSLFFRKHNSMLQVSRKLLLFDVVFCLPKYINNKIITRNSTNPYRIWLY
jgi:hypothetical protein